jgi:hypothetical protein
MKLRRKKPDSARLRQRRTNVEEDLPKPANFSYRARRSDEELNVGRRERKNIVPSKLYSGRFWLQRSGLIVLLVAIVVSVVNILSLSAPARVVSLTDNNSSAFVLNKAAYQAAADRLLNESIWNHNKVTVDTAKIDRQLLAQFPELASVSITIPPLTHHPIVYLQPAQAAIVIQSSSSGSFVLNSNGRVLLATSHDPLAAGEAASLPVVTDLSGLKLALGRQVLPANTVSFVQTVVAQLAAKKYTVTSMSLPPAASELDVALAGQAYTIKFNLENSDARQQVGTFLATIAELQSQGITPAHYVDVRVDGRAYYQ